MVASHGITRGCAEERFCPDQPATRAEMACFLIRAIGGFDGFDPPGEVDRLITEAGAEVRTQSWSWTYISN